MILCIEGVDGCGKGTQVELLVARLAPKFRSVEVLHFPDRSTQIGGVIDRFLRGGIFVASEGVSDVRVESQAQALALQSLMLVNRLEHYQKLCARSNEDVVDLLILDRYTPSALAYGAADGIPIGLLERVHECLPRANIAVLFDIPVEESFRRRPKRADAYEANRERLEAARQVYLDIFARGGERWRVVDGCRPPEEIAEEIAGMVEEMI